MEQVQKDSLLLSPVPGMQCAIVFQSPASATGMRILWRKSAPPPLLDNGADRIKENSLRQQMTEAGDPAVLIEQKVHKCDRCGSQTVFAFRYTHFYMQLLQLRGGEPGSIQNPDRSTIRYHSIQDRSTIINRYL